MTSENLEKSGLSSAQIRHLLGLLLYMLLPCDFYECVDVLKCQNNVLISLSHK